MPLGYAAEYTIKTSSKGTSIENMIKQIYAMKEGMTPVLEDLAADTSRQIAYIINHNKKRPGAYKKDSLANAFKTGDVKITPSTVSIGIGDLDYLSVEYPYWEVVDKGGYIPLSTSSKKGVPGWYGNRQAPDAGSDGEDFFHYHPYTQGNYLIKPTNPIRPMNYIALTNIWLKEHFSTVVRNYFSRKHTKGPTIGSTYRKH